MAKKVDYWLGIPLCFILSGLNSILKLIPTKKIKTSAPDKILFIKLAELGAIILSYPLLERVKKEYPSAKLFYLTFAANKDIFNLLDKIIPKERIILIRENSLFHFVFDTLRAISRLHKADLDIIFDLEFFSRFTSILTYLIGAKKRAGFYPYAFEGLYRGNLLTHKIQFNPLSHITKTYLSMFQGSKKNTMCSPELNQAQNDAIYFPKYTSSPEIRKRILCKLNDLGIKTGNKLFLVNIGEGLLPLREWPTSNFFALAELILKDENNCIIAIGTLDALKTTKIMIDALNNPRCINLVNKTELSELAELFSFAEALICNDCGLAHLAMLSSTKTFVIFGPESPQVFRPLNQNIQVIYSNWPCSPCLSVFNHRNSACRDNLCLKIIEPQDLYNFIFPNTSIKD